LSTRFGLEIRTAMAADAQGLLELLKAADLAAGALSPAFLAERLDALRHRSGAVLLAHEWGPPSGLVALHWYETFDAAAPTALITSLLVGVDARRRGIGRALLKSAAQSARQAGCDALLMSVPHDDISLEGFCKATGFVEAGAAFARPLRKKG
jgi:GNAT superfamily N-acetyltransferase